MMCSVPGGVFGTGNAFHYLLKIDEMNSYLNNPLDSRQLRAFIMLAREGSFTAAAKELHLTQSAVSHAMKALEEDVGCRLLDRVRKKVLLTQAGEQFLVRAERIFQEMGGARAELEALGEWGCGRLRIGASASRTLNFRRCSPTSWFFWWTRNIRGRRRAGRCARTCRCSSIFCI
jgi:DNA-binding MarR family transcriptional regulator